MQRPSEAHLGPTLGGQNIPIQLFPTPVTPHQQPHQLAPAPVRRPQAAVRPPAPPNRPLAAVFRVASTVSRRPADLRVRARFSAPSTGKPSPFH
jgi:hypothetical protein